MNDSPGVANERAARGVPAHSFPDSPQIQNLKSKIQNSSAELLLVVLILISLNIVAAYDWLLTRILRLTRPLHTKPTFQRGFDTTHLSRSVARRLRPME